MRMSQFFLPTMKDHPSEAVAVSHQLMLRAGMINQHAAGLFTWLPLGNRVLRKIEALVRAGMDEAGAQEITMPILQPTEPWKQSGRWEAYGQEMLRMKDRQGRDLIFSPTNEEIVTDVFRAHAQSWRDMPCLLYQIQWKFRDELRPRFGVLRAREFLMKDAYSFDLDAVSAEQTYMKMMMAYMRIFARLGIRAIPMRADSGQIGGDCCHEMIVLAETGESGVFCDKAWQEFDTCASMPHDTGNTDALKSWFQNVTQLYAATEDKHDPRTCPVPDTQLLATRGIEVGHIFSFGTKYTVPMGLKLASREGDPIAPHGGAYGIGVSRLVGAVIEANHDAAGIVWPHQIAPFSVGIIQLRPGHADSNSVANALSQSLTQAGAEPLWDDREDSPGSKFATMDLIGLPWSITIGHHGLKSGTVDLKHRATGRKESVSAESAINTVLNDDIFAR
ncbi:MAG: proline--tRNA ligase [Alphaproteobacteria bacterium]|nr:MAG: proline--tRNA ligase [Alphaproteobacteria bacterium]